MVFEIPHFKVYFNGHEDGEITHYGTDCTHLPYLYTESTNP
jgi:hypothetical protein